MKFRYNAIISVLKPLTSRQAEEIEELKKFRENKIKQECHYLEQENKSLKQERDWMAKKIRQSAEYAGKMKKEKEEIEKTL